MQNTIFELFSAYGGAKRVIECMNDIGYKFKNEDLLKTALTHISLANDENIESNQRMEFLGDSVLSFVIASETYGLYPECDEGGLTRIRAVLVCEKMLAELANELHLGEMIRFGRSEKMSDGVHKRSILADTFEAVLGAILLDSDIITAREWLLKCFGDRLEGVEPSGDANYKSKLQIFFQKRDKSTDVVHYRLKDRRGPDHAPVFKSEAIYRGKVIGFGKGRSRKQAEQNAALCALEKLGIKE